MILLNFITKILKITTYMNAEISRKFTSGFRALLFVCAVPMMAAPLAAQDAKPMTIEADDLLEWNQTDGLYIAKGNAVVVQEDATIKGDLLVATYDPDSQDKTVETVTATGNMSFKDNDITASGAKLIYSVKDEDYQVDGPKAIVTGARGTITASKSIVLDTLDDKRQHMIATGNAVYNDANGRRMAGDLINAFFDAEGAMETVEAEGNVNVRTNTGSTASGDAGVYDAVSERATITGNAIITDGGSQMRGARAEVDFKTGNSRILSDGTGGRVTGVLVSN